MNMVFKPIVVYKPMEKLTKTLSRIIKEERVTVYKVAKGIGVDFSSLYRALKADGNLGAHTVDKILGFLGYEIEFVKSKRKGVKPKGSPSRSRRSK